VQPSFLNYTTLPYYLLNQHPFPLWERDNLHGEIFTLSLTLNRAHKSEVRQQTHKCFYPVLTLSHQWALFITPFGKSSLFPPLWKTISLSFGKGGQGGI